MLWSGIKIDKNMYQREKIQSGRGYVGKECRESDLRIGKVVEQRRRWNTPGNQRSNTPCQADMVNGPVSLRHPDTDGAKDKWNPQGINNSIVHVESTAFPKTGWWRSALETKSISKKPSKEDWKRWPAPHILLLRRRSPSFRPSSSWALAASSALLLLLHSNSARTCLQPLAAAATTASQRQRLKRKWRENRPPDWARAAKTDQRPTSRPTVHLCRRQRRQRAAGKALFQVFFSCKKT